MCFQLIKTAEDRSENLESLYGKLDDYIYKALLRKLAMKGCADKPRGWSVPDDWSVETLKSPRRRNWRKSHLLMPVTSRCCLWNTSHLSNQVVHSSADAEVSAMILHRNSGSRRMAKGTEGEFSEHILQIFNPLSGLLGMLLTPDKHAAIETAFGETFADFPENQN